MSLEQQLRAGLAHTLERTNFSGIGELHRGKVRDSYVQGDKRVIVVTDRVSAFDHVLGTIPFKGQILNGISAYWFDQVKDVCPTHLLRVADPQVSIVAECSPIPLEMVVRGYLTGTSSTSIWTHYARGERTYCGHQLADGLRKHHRFEVPLLTPTTKAAAGEHDQPVSLSQAADLVGADTLDEICSASAALFARGQQVAAERGLILVDTKYEFGRFADGRLALIDEVHTPDSSRYWHADSYEQSMLAGDDPKALDKEFIRRALVEQGYQGEGLPPPLSDALRMETARRYCELYELVTGQPFEPNTEPPGPRIARALGAQDER